LFVNLNELGFYEFFNHKVFSKYDCPVPSFQIEKYYAKLQENEVYKNRYRNQNNLSHFLPQNMDTISYRQSSTQYDYNNESYLDTKPRNLETQIHNETQKFNQIMEEQYREFDFSYYYVDSSTKYQVIKEFI
jgi:hypothetical protein